MGQAWGNLQSTFKSKIPEEKVRAIIDHIFDRAIKDAKDRAKSKDPSSPQIEKNTLTFDEMHSAIVQVFQELNKNIPGAKYAPPTKDQVAEMLKNFDTNEDKQIDREEFSKFVQKFTVDLVRIYAKELLIMTVAIPAAALVTKRATRGVPFLGNLVAKIPTTVFVAGVTSAAVVLFNK
ncbi:uncharacterized protein LOC131069963 [Cryptomeria japonica]|uniref:uncharacterized protein LOC131069963 n=1 Tax=Cryptomeria japonica TaxID=3369 RepID=UPI0025AD53DF|nr:uncharacterized protein LOC131069963 [Cryptomeria japonica]